MKSKKKNKQTNSLSKHFTQPFTLDDYDMRRVWDANTELAFEFYTKSLRSAIVLSNIAKSEIVNRLNSSHASHDTYSYSAIDDTVFMHAENRDVIGSILFIRSYGRLTADLGSIDAAASAQDEFAKAIAKKLST